MSSDSYYNKVGQIEHKELVEFIDHNQTALTIKINNQFVKTSVNYVKGNYFSLLKFHTYDFYNEPISCVFRYKDDIYMFTSYLRSSKVDYLIDIPPDIFQLQRRNDFRVSIPIGLPQDCLIKYARGIAKNVKAEIRDLSMGGCQISTAAFDIEMTAGDEFEVSLKLDKFDFPQLKMTARHVKRIEEQDTLLIGASFEPLDGDSLNDMRSLLMYIDRRSRGKNEK